MAGNRRAVFVTDEQIIESYRETHSCNKTAQDLGLAAWTVERVLRKLKEPRIGLVEYRKRITKFKGQEQAIRELHEHGGTFDDIRREFGDASPWAIRTAIARAGGTLRADRPGIRIKPEEMERIRELHNSGMSQIGISLEIGRSQATISRALRKSGISAHVFSGENHSMWKGGRYIDSSGYVRAWVAKDDPLVKMALSSGHVLEHRLVMARNLGRALRSSETVHHIDGDRTNNLIENLELRQGRHGKHVAMVCLDCGSHNIGHAPLSSTLEE